MKRITTEEREACFDKLWNRYLDSLMRLNSSHPATLEREVRSIISDFNALKSDCASEIDDTQEAPGWLSSFKNLLAGILDKQGRFYDAINTYKEAIALNHYNLHHLENYMRMLIRLRRLKEASSTLNELNIDTLEMEDESTAIHILNWSFRYPEIAVGVKAELLKRCVELVAVHSNLDVPLQIVGRSKKGAKYSAASDTTP